MGSHLGTTINRLHRVRDQTLSYLASTVYYQKPHAYLVQRLKGVHQSADYQKLPRWAKDQIAGYEEGYCAAILHLLEWRYRRISDGAYIPESEVDWGKREVENGAHFWKGTDYMYSDPEPAK